MSTSALFSPHPSTSALPSTSADPIHLNNKTRFTRGRSAGVAQNGSSVSPTRPAASGAASTRSRRSQTASKEPSPEKMSASENPPNGDAIHYQHDIDAVASTPEYSHVDTNGEPAPIVDPVPSDKPPSDAKSTTSNPAKKIILVFGRKRKADDHDESASVVSLPPPESNGDSASARPSPPAAHPPEDMHSSAHSDIANDAPSPAPPNVVAGPSIPPATAPTPPTSHPADDKKPTRAPRKRRKWLRKGEVDPEDHKAVAEQRARHALIDVALEALDQQEKLVLGGTHPDLVELWAECERRREIQLAYNRYSEECQLRELRHLFLQETGQIREQFKVGTRHDKTNTSTTVKIFPPR